MKTPSMGSMVMGGSAVGNCRAGAQPSGPAHVQVGEELMKHKGESELSTPCTRPAPHKY